MKELAVIFCTGFMALAIVGCSQADVKPSAHSNAQEFAQTVMLDRELDDDGSWHYSKPTENQYAQTAETVATYLGMCGVSIDTHTVADRLRKNERIDGVGVYLACVHSCNGKKGVIFGKRNGFRSLPTPILVRVDGVWRIMAYHDELRVLCYDSHGKASISIPPTQFDIGYMDSNMESVFVADLGYSLGTVPGVDE